VSHRYGDSGLGDGSIIPIWHYGTFVNTAGKLTVIHCTRDEGVVETSVPAFASSEGRIEANRIASSEAHQRMILDTARENLKHRVQWAWGSNCRRLHQLLLHPPERQHSAESYNVGVGLALMIGFAVVNSEK
jgi:hypothetical protein